MKVGWTQFKKLRMGNEFASCIFLLLFLILHAPGNASGQMDHVLRLPGMDVAAQQAEEVKHVKHSHGHGHSSSPHLDLGMAHMDSSAKVFFVLNDLKIGKKIYFPQLDLSKSFHFLPRQEAEAIPFSSKELPYLLHFFSFPQDSPQAMAMEEALSSCEAEGNEGEIKFCATSLDSLLDFARSVFGSDSGFEILRTSQPTKSTPVFQNYTVLQVKEMTSPKMIACHSMPYPYAVYFCHIQKSETKVFEVSLDGENGDRVDAVSVCHMDTSSWDPGHVAFRMIGAKPGSSEVCHFLLADALAVVSVLPTFA